MISIKKCYFLILKHLIGLINIFGRYFELLKNPLAYYGFLLIISKTLAHEFIVLFLLAVYPHLTKNQKETFAISSSDTLSPYLIDFSPLNSRSINISKDRLNSLSQGISSESDYFTLSHLYYLHSLTQLLLIFSTQNLAFFIL